MNQQNFNNASLQTTPPTTNLSNSSQFNNIAVDILDADMKCLDKKNSSIPINIIEAYMTRTWHGLPEPIKHSSYISCSQLWTESNSNLILPSLVDILTFKYVFYPLLTSRYSR